MESVSAEELDLMWTEQERRCEQAREEFKREAEGTQWFNAALERMGEAGIAEKTPSRFCTAHP